MSPLIIPPNFPHFLPTITIFNALQTRKFIITIKLCVRVAQPRPPRVKEKKTKPSTIKCHLKCNQFGRKATCPGQHNQCTWGPCLFALSALFIATVQQPITQPSGQRVHDEEPWGPAGVFMGRFIIRSRRLLSSLWQIISFFSPRTCFLFAKQGKSVHTFGQIACIIHICVWIRHGCVRTTSNRGVRCKLKTRHMDLVQSILTHRFYRKTSTKESFLLTTELFRT